MAGIYYTPPHQSQVGVQDPHRAVNCAAYATAMFANRATLGGCRVTGQTVRALSNEPRPDPSSPGLNVDQCRDVLHHLGIAAAAVRGVSRVSVRDRLRQGRPVLIAIVYKFLPPDYRSSGTFLGPHMLYLNAISPGNSIQVYDPLAKASRWMPSLAVFQAAAAIGEIQIVYGRTVPLLSEG